ncbi:unnamed protein product [Clonostachys solani]|uniref:Uncharacterized protein n=1 Tax=Clonostachys solani TaxID=160281 RepID=A0A9N9YX35_9HYPO|nr:unnamed protein product [Clonostachys solani]
MLKHIVNYLKCNRQTEEQPLSGKRCNPFAYMLKFKRHLKFKAATNSRKPRLDISSYLERLRKQKKPDTARPSFEPLLVPAEQGQSLTPDSVISAQPKVLVLEGHNDDPIWFDHARPKGAIDRSMRESDMAEADIVLLTVGSVDDPVLTRRLSEIPDEKSRVIVASRTFRLRGIPNDRCTIVTANPSADFAGSSAIDTSTRVQLPPFPPSSFSIGIIANDPQTARDWVNHRREIPETLQVGDHRITLISNHKPQQGKGSPVDGYIVIATDNYETIALPEGPWPIVGVYKDPDMDALKQLPGATRTNPLVLCLSDPLPALLRRIIFRKLVESQKRGEIPLSRIDPFINIQSPMPSVSE